MPAARRNVRTGSVIVRSARPSVAALAAKKATKAAGKAAGPVQSRAAKEKDKERAQGKNSATPAMAAARPVGPKVRATEPSPAVNALAKALEKFRKQDWKNSAEELRAGIEKFPGEAEVLERMRSYLKICERNLAPKAPEPKTPEEHYQSGILALNAGSFDDSIAHLQKALALKERTEAAHYALACAHALKRDRPGAIKNLKTAIEMNPENRIHAAADSDFELVRDEAEFAELVGGRTHD